MNNDSNYILKTKNKASRMHKYHWGAKSTGNI